MARGPGGTAAKRVRDGTPYVFARLVRRHYAEAMVSGALTIEQALAERLAVAVRAVVGPDAPAAAQWLSRSTDEKFGDYQFNGAMPLAKSVGKPPREVAAALVAQLRVDDLCEPPVVAGPGFINLTLKPTAVAARLATIPTASEPDRLGLAPVAMPQTIVVDLSSPNLAKEMHVGHLRSTVIGDCVARLLEFEGHRVHRVNHVGDWGTQFGMLLAHLRAVQPLVLDHPDQLRLGDLEAFYVEAKRRFDEDPAFADEARRTVVALQSGDPATRAVWRAFCEESLRHCREIYDRLGITALIEQGESFYNDRLSPLVRELIERGVAVESDGAICIFLEGFKTREGEPMGWIIRKSDGGYLYATTDLAAIRFRIHELGAQRIIYVVGLDAGSKDHFELLFAAARKAGLVPEGVSLEHLGFGSMLGPDGRPFKTREGGTVKLRELLDEAVSRARAVLTTQGTEDTERAPQRVRPNDDSIGTGAREFAPDQVDAISRTIGIGAVKYFDLSHTPTSAYRFDFDTMLSLDGNTAPYMLYAYARIRSIGRKAGVDYADIPAHTPIVLEHETEIRLGKMLLRFQETIDLAARELRPNVLTDYLFELSKRFSLFYDRKRGVRVIDAEPAGLRLSRLRLCDLTARTLKVGLWLLGIGTVEQM